MGCAHSHGDDHDPAPSNAQQKYAGAEAAPTAEHLAAFAAADLPLHMNHEVAQAAPCTGSAADSSSNNNNNNNNNNDTPGDAEVLQLAANMQLRESLQELDAHRAPSPVGVAATEPTPSITARRRARTVRIALKAFGINGNVHQFSGGGPAPSTMARSCRFVRKWLPHVIRFQPGDDDTTTIAASEAAFTSQLPTPTAATGSPTLAWSANESHYFAESRDSQVTRPPGAGAGSMRSSLGPAHDAAPFAGVDDDALLPGVVASHPDAVVSFVASPDTHQHRHPTAPSTPSARLTSEALAENARWQRSRRRVTFSVPSSAATSLRTSIALPMEVSAPSPPFDESPVLV